MEVRPDAAQKSYRSPWWGSVQDSGGSAEIQVSLDGAGTTALSSVTTELAGKPAPESQLAIYVHGRVLSAPVVMAPLTSGTMIIAGFTGGQAQQIVDGLAAQ
jgi:preprotein translocase subunit SecD